MTTNTYSSPVYHSSEEIPIELRERPQWVLWRLEPGADGRLTKRPYQLNGALASSTNPATWATFDRVCDRPRTAEAGIGFVFAPDDGLVGVDLDGCRNPETGELDEWARDIIADLTSYTEVSASGSGVHIIVKGTLPSNVNRKLTGLPNRYGKQPGVEIYDRGRYFAVTGLHVEGTPTTIEHRQAVLAALYDRFKTQRTERTSVPAPVTIDASDDELLERMFAAANGGTIQALWSGDTAAYGGDDSAADLALCAHLAFWTGRDAERIDRLFRRSGLMRPKWDTRHFADGATYGQRTIERAIAGCSEVYTPSMPVYRNGGSSSSAQDSEARRFALTDLGNAERLVARHGRVIRYCERRGSWLVWDGTRWVPDERGTVVQLAAETVRAMYHEAASLDDPDQRTALAKHAIASESAKRIRDMLALAKSLPGIPVVPDEFDTDPWLLNCPNGVLDLRTGTLLPHDPSRLITKLAGAPYDPQAECPRWLRFLEDILPDPDVRRYIQKRVGYQLTGSTREQDMAIAYGSGSNGKSTFIRTLLAMMGDYASQVSPELLIKKENDSRQQVLIAKLHGRRFVASVEIEDGKQMAEGLMKQLTGEDRQTAWVLYHGAFEFEPTHKLLMAVNHKPVIRGTDHAVWRRIRLVPFTVTIERPDKDLPDKLREELPGILRWAVEGCLLWQREGLEPPAAIQAATLEYRHEMDVVGRFISECCVLAPTAKVSKPALREQYEAWCTENGERPLSAKAFAARLKERGITDGKSGSTRVWQGIGLSDGNPGEQSSLGQMGQMGQLDRQINPYRFPRVEFSQLTVPSVPSVPNADDVEVF